jgi:hypothetical protein
MSIFLSIFFCLGYELFSRLRIDSGGERRRKDHVQKMDILSPAGLGARGRKE